MLQHTSLLALPALLCSIGFVAPSLAAQDGGDRVAEMLGATSWREIGPVNYTGRINDVDVDPRDRSVWFVASATGGLWKTENDGATFRSIFTTKTAFSIGDIAVAPSAPDTIYVGTGEANNQRSSYWGDGVHKTTDGGKTWQNVGLAKSEHIGRIAVHPTNADVLYVAAAGALYSSNEDRGLYRSKDGGKSWQRVLHVDADTGVIDVCLDPSNPDRVLAASYERRRRAWDFREGGDGSKLWLSEDGGESFDEVKGIPGGDIGRIGIAFAASNPKVAYAIVENLNPAERQTRRPARTTDEDGGRDRESAPGAVAAAAAPPAGGEVYRSDDGGKSWAKVSTRKVGGEPHYYYGQIRIDPRDENRLYVLGVAVWTSDDGGKRWRTSIARNLHPDHHALWIDPADPARLLLGNDGGIALSYDRGANWRHFANLPIAQIYAIGVDLRDPYIVYGGTQDNGTWGIPSRSTTNERLGREHALKINGGDGFCVQVDPDEPDIVYSESQFGAMSRQNLATGERASIRPSAPRGAPALRFNWMTPILISPHNPRTIYTGSQMLHRSRNRGDRWEAISGDLSTNDREKLAGDVPHCTITTIDESPQMVDRLLVGTDDGKVWWTNNGGRDWVDLTSRFAELPAGRWVSRVAFSPHDADRAYVAFTGYREDDHRPYLYLTTDGGTTFRSIVNDLPADQPINVVREHPRNPDCVLVGTEFGAYASVDGGGSWAVLGKGLPTVAVHDLLVHPREDEVVVGTHGRGCFVLDAQVLAEASTSTLRKPFHLFAATDGRPTRRVFTSNRYPAAAGWRADQPDASPQFHYWLGAATEDDVRLRVLDATGKELWSTNGVGEAGYHQASWGGGGARGRGGFGGFGGGAGGGGAGTAGDYVVELSVGSAKTRRTFRVHPAPDGAVDTTGVEDAARDSTTRDY
jgi:photosystem II stability/assembly factor-like uncharacterized protein